jgi:hydrogenase expression/formation protein HypE
MTSRHNGPSLPAGKLPLTLLSELLDALPTDSPQLLLGPSAGEDAAVIDFAHGDERVLVVKSDPITFATDEIGYYAVNICVNDLAVTGATPRFYLPTLLMPAGDTSEERVRDTYRQIGDACVELNIVVAGGHSEITHAVNQPIIAGTLLGEAPRNGFVTSGGGRPGDVVLMIGVAPVEGTSILAREMREPLLSGGWSEHDLDVAAGFLHNPGISVLAPAHAVLSAGGITGMHDPTEGGIATGLAEMALAAGTGMEVNLDAIPIPDVSRRLCAAFGLDPLGLIASGALLATVTPAQVEYVIDRCHEQGWQGAAIGRLTDDRKLRAYQGGRRVDFPTFEADELTKLFA